MAIVPVIASPDIELDTCMKRVKTKKILLINASRERKKSQRIENLIIDQTILTIQILKIRNLTLPDFSI
jgi:c-di-GMP-related signal transduction protein